MSATETDRSDVESVTGVIVEHQRIPLYSHIPGAQRCGGCDSLHGASDGPNSPRHAQHVAEQILASDWLAARDARVAREALRKFADTRGVNVGDEDSEWWQGYRQAQRECVHDAAKFAAAPEATQ